MQKCIFDKQNNMISELKKEECVEVRVDGKCEKNS